VSHVPPDSGVFGIMERDVCVYIGSSWNLRGRLLELANLVAEPEGLSIIWVPCPESESAARCQALELELLTEPDNNAIERFPGIHLRPEPLRRSI
jgi:hypothetical protein